MNTIIFLVEVGAADIGAVFKHLKDTPSIAVVNLSTTDKQLATGQEEYNFINKEDWSTSEYAWFSEIDGERYGIHKDQIIKKSCDHIGINKIHLNKIHMLDNL